jgi:ElaB/YqjD/DUF883 family membrane-anchored ribosome-binding protein
MLNMYTVLKFSANAGAAACLAHRVASDIARRSPYGAVGAATAIGVLTGMLFAKRRHRPT